MDRETIRPRVAGAAPEEGLRAAHALSVEEAFAALDSSEEGLSAAEAQSRLQVYGPNRLQTRKRPSAWKLLLLQFHNPLIYVLLATAVATALLQHWVDVGVILGVVVANAVIGFLQEAQAERAIESLGQMLAPQAVTRRDGAQVSLPASELAPGDVVLVEAGDSIPADLRLFRAKNLQMDEAALTGESLPVAKSPEALSAEAPLGDRSNLAFAGALATSGTGEGLVIATGNATEIGRIADMLEEVTGVDTPLARRLGRFSKTITLVILASCAVIFLLGVVAGRELEQMLMATVALAVSAIPEGLPAIMTIALAIGVKRMAARNAVVRKLPAVEALGSATVICTDKTGTLTRNEMTVTRIVVPDGEFAVAGSGYEPRGAVTDVGGRETSDNPASLDALARAGALCNDARLQCDGGRWLVAGDPTEGALLTLAGKVGLNADELAAQWPRRDEIPFDSRVQFMATLHRGEADRPVVFAKGAPEAVLARCGRQYGSDEPLDVETWRRSAERLAAEGLRVLALAEKPWDAGDAALALDRVEADFTLLGLVGMTDPPRPEASDAVQKCHSAGIRVVMITGDHVATARAIASQIGLGAGDAAVTGAELETFDQAEFDRVAAEVDVFARVAPGQKLKIVQALQRQGHVVAMTGDGVNDAPALKQADIGVAMGLTGSDVSKEAAAMVLLDDNFASIERAVEEGRTVFNNLKKTLIFILPTNGGECLTLATALLFGTVLPILPLHVLWINLVTTVALAITLAFEPVEPDVMRRPPRDPAAPLIDGGLVLRSAVVSAWIALGTFGLFFYELSQGSSLETARCVAVNVIVFFEAAYVFNSRRLSGSVLNRQGLLGNPVVWWGVGAVTALQAAFTYWPVTQTLFHIAPLDARMWLRVLGASLALLLLVELEKAITRRLRTRIPSRR